MPGSSPGVTSGFCGARLRIASTRTPTFNFQTAASSLRAAGSCECAPDDRLRGAIQRRHSGMVRRTRPGISRFRVRCFASPRNDGVWVASSPQRRQTQVHIRLRDLAARCARGLHLSLAPTKGRGECRVPAAPAASCAIVLVERTRVTTSTPESPGIPARNGFTAYFALSSVTGRFCHRRPRTNVLPKPGRADITSANLTPASGRQDHTTSPYAATSLVRSLGDRSQASSTRPAITSRARRCRVHRIPSRVRDDRDTPLVWDGMARTCRDDLPDG
jgi:hypothetical protein